jgi:outer membrane protein OmpA-like peptidoglycan-associated protein
MKNGFTRPILIAFVVVSATLAGSCATKKHVRDIAAPIQAKTDSADQQNTDQDIRQANQASGRSADSPDSLRSVIANLDDYKLQTSLAVPFPFNKYTLSADAKQDLDKLANEIKNGNRFFIAIEGYDDKTGSKADKAALNRRRADAVVEYLAAKHDVPINRIYMLGLGAEQPVASDKTSEGRAKNRRVEVKVFSANPGTNTIVIPQFPWPPPTASARQVIPRNLLSHGQSTTQLGDLNTVLCAALDRNAYTEKSYFAVPHGFALVTRLEQIEVDGRSKMSRDRWLIGPSPALSNFSVSSYLARLFTANPGYYRLIVFVVTDVPFAQTSAKISDYEAIKWLSEGLNVLPQEIRTKPYDETVDCTALIYEFERQPDKNPSILLPSRLDAGTHLTKSGLLASLSTVGSP